jgi:hypothetical protein
MGWTRKQCEALGLGHLFPSKGPKVEGKRGPVPKDASGLSLLPYATPDDPRAWLIVIPKWTPPSLNSFLSSHWAARRKSKGAAMALVGACCFQAGVTRATGRRRVSIVVTVNHRSHRFDSDNVPKAILDGLKHAGALVDDGPDWCECVPPEVVVGTDKGTVIRLEELS